MQKNKTIRHGEHSNDVGPISDNEFDNRTALRDALSPEKRAELDQELVDLILVLDGASQKCLALLKRGANPNAFVSNSIPILVSAASLGYLTITLHLLDGRAGFDDPQMIIDAFVASIENGQWRTAEALQSHLPNLTDSMLTDIRRAALTAKNRYHTKCYKLAMEICKTLRAHEAQRPGYMSTSQTRAYGPNTLRIKSVDKLVSGMPTP